MPRTPTRLAFVVVGLLVALTLGSCSDDAPAKAATTTTERPATTTTAAAESPDGETAPTNGVTPVAGDCIEPVTPTSGAGPQLPAIVPCSETHGGEIVSISTLTDPPDAPYPAVSDLTGDTSTALVACQGDGTRPGEFGEFAGDNRIESPETEGGDAGAHRAWIVSSLEAVLFVPGPAAWSDGARWAACAAVVHNSSAALSAYDGSARGLRAPGKLTDALAWCRTDDDQSGDYSVVSCDQPHSLEQLASFQVGADGDAYPGNDQIDALAGELCPGLASTATAKRSESVTETQFGLSWTFPREEDWAGGDRTGRCYMRSINEPTTGSFSAGTA